MHLLVTELPNLSFATPKGKGIYQNMNDTTLVSCSSQQLYDIPNEAMRLGPWCDMRPEVSAHNSSFWSCHYSLHTKTKKIQQNRTKPIRFGRQIEVTNRTRGIEWTQHFKPHANPTPVKKLEPLNPTIPELYRQGKKSPSHGSKRVGGWRPEPYTEEGGN